MRVLPLIDKSYFPQLWAEKAIYKREGVNERMKINKAVLGMLTGGVLALAIGVSAMADTLTPIASITTATTDNTQFTSAPTGDTLVVTYGDGVIASKIGFGTGGPVVVNLTATGGKTTILGGGVFEEVFTGGSFSDFVGPNKLLAGTFTGGSILGQAGAVTGGLDITGVTYDADSIFLGSYSPFGGAISLTYNVIKPGGYNLTGGNLNSFTATDSGTYSAVQSSAVPEPAAIAPFLMGGLSLLGLTFRASKARRTHNATA